MTSLLGYQVQIVTPAYQTMVRATWPAVLKVIVPGGLDAGLLTEWRRRRPDGLLILRRYFPDEDLRADKIATTLAAAEEIRHLAPILEVPINEAHQTSASDIAELASYSVRFVTQAYSAGFKAAVGVFSEGNPSNLDWWSAFYPALRAARVAGGYLALHEYGIPALGFEDWHLLRHRRVWSILPEDCRVPILITEAGIDGGIEGRREVGWRGYMGSWRYADWLRRYHAEIAKDTYVHGATLFLCGGNDQWRLFDLGDEVDLRPVFTDSLPMPARWTPTQPKEKPMPTRAELEQIVHDAAVRHDVDPDLFDRLVNQESGYSPNAASPAGAKGLTQLMDATAAALGVTDSLDPVQNADGGARYLAEKLRAYRGDRIRALIAYNGGHGAVQAWEAGDPLAESENYVRAILGVSLWSTRPDPCVVQFGQEFQDALSLEERGLGWLASACGPIALAGMRTRLGKPAEAADVLRSAAAFKHPDGRPLWTAQHGMVGADVFEAAETLATLWGMRLHRHMTPADLRLALDQGGAIISTPRHYFYVIRPSLSDDDLMVGNTGTALIEGAPWMSIEEIERAGGGILATWTGELVEDPVPAPVSVSPAVLGALDILWKAAGANVEMQRAIIRVKEELGLQPKGG